MNCIKSGNISVEGEFSKSTGINLAYDMLPSCFPPPIMPFEHQVHIKTPLLMTRLCVTLIERKVMSPARYTADFSTGVGCRIFKANEDKVHSSIVLVFLGRILS